MPDRAALTGILFVLTTGIPWERLPQELGYGSGVTCWRRLRDWNQAGVWHRLHEVLLAKLREADLIDWERASIDSATVPAPGGAMKRVLSQRHGLSGDALRARVERLTRTGLVIIPNVWGGGTILTPSPLFDELLQLTSESEGVGKTE